MPAWITSLLREDTPLPMPPVASATITSWPASAACRAMARPTTPAPITRTCIAVLVARSAYPLKPIEILRRPVEQIRLLGRARAFRQELARVPEHPVAVGSLVDREVALEHPPLRPERRDARVDVGLPRVGQHLRRRRLREAVEFVAA